MRRVWVSALVCAMIAGAGEAAADDAHAAAPKALLAEQVRALGAGDAKAFAATFDEDGFAFLPAAADEARGGDAIAGVAKRWLAGLGKVKLKLEGARYGREWFDAELVVTPGPRLRLTGVITARLGDGEPSYKVGALHLSEPTDDKLVLAAAAAGKLPALPRIAGADELAGGSAADRPDRIATFASRLVDDPAVVVIGSAANERAVGKAAVRKLLTGWKGLKLTTLELRTSEDDDNMMLGWSVGHVEATVQVAGKPVKLPYRVLMVVLEPMAVAEEHGAKTQLMAAHFSIATR